MTTCYIALGSNLGDRLANLRAALAAMDERGIAVTARSSIWESESVPPGQPSYLNAVVAIETGLSPEDLLSELKAVEWQFGRRPSPRWSPRPLDLDILFHGDTRVESPALTVPHPRLGERPFVLAPLSDVIRGPLPVLRITARDLLARAGLHGVSRYASF